MKPRWMSSTGRLVAVAVSRLVRNSSFSLDSDQAAILEVSASLPVEFPPRCVKFVVSPSNESRPLKRLQNRKSSLVRDVPVARRGLGELDEHVVLLVGIGLGKSNRRRTLQ